MATPVPVEEIINRLNKNPKYDYSYFLRSDKPDLGNLLISKVLTGKGRDFVIRQIKAPIERVLIRAVKLYIQVFGAITKENTTKRNTHVILDLKQEFFQHYIGGRRALLDSAWELLAFEVEHDNAHYGWMLDWLVTKIAEEKAKGNWIERPAKFPQEGCWKE